MQSFGGTFHVDISMGKGSVGGDSDGGERGRGRSGVENGDGKRRGRGGRGRGRVVGSNRDRARDVSGSDGDVGGGGTVGKDVCHKENGGGARKCSAVTNRSQISKKKVIVQGAQCIWGTLRSTISSLTSIPHKSLVIK